jgi:YfiH family protein
VTDDAERVLAVRTADCAPILLASRDGRVAAAVHAGWRGVIARVVPVAVEAMKRLAPESCRTGLAAAIGPCIGPGRFEVGPEVVAEFVRVFGARTTHARSADRPGEPGRVDLKGAIAEQLVTAGLKAADIDVLPHCTASDPAFFFSHRRERGRTGRMVALVAPRCA